MEKMKDLKDLLTHEVLDLYSVEEQIIAALPKMIEKAGNEQLKQALQEHLAITEEQRRRLDEVKSRLQPNGEQKEGGEDGQEKKGFLSGLFGNSGGSQKCRGMMGLIEEGEKVMNEEMNPEVLDAAIIACAQKIEHYEICGYGTARAYARELNLQEVSQLLEKTLNEEYEADDRLTQMALGGVNQEAETAGRGRRRSGGGKSGGGGNGRGSKSSKSSKGAPRKAASKGGSKSASKGGRKSASKGASKSASKKSASSGRGGSKGSSRGNSGGRSKSGGSKGTAAKKGASKGSRGR